MSISDGSGAMFDRIAERYDRLNTLCSFGGHHRWRRRLVAALGDLTGGHFLDVATGTADVAIAIARRNESARVTGLDPSEGMLAVGADKLRKRGLGDRVSLVVGDAQELPFDDDAFSGSTISFGIRNVPDRARGLAEMSRVTKPGARVAILELGEPEGIFAGAARIHVHGVVPRLGSLIAGDDAYDYLSRSIEAFPPPPVVLEMMAAAGLTQLEHEPFMFGGVNLFVGTVPARARG